jgi:hypothetical protein
MDVIATPRIRRTSVLGADIKTPTVRSLRGIHVRMTCNSAGLGRSRLSGLRLSNSDTK